MARQGIVKALETGLKPDKVFEASQVAFKAMGWEIYKMRQIAFLVEARTTTAEGYILANIITKVFGTPEINITVKSDTASQSSVDEIAARILEELNKALAAK